MENKPDKIYLQIDAKGDTPNDFKELFGVTWCAEKINDNDLDYISAERVKELEKEVQKWKSMYNERSGGYA
jgi:hypothetical protein